MDLRIDQLKKLGADIDPQHLDIEKTAPNIDAFLSKVDEDASSYPVGSEIATYHSICPQNGKFEYIPSGFSGKPEGGN